MAAEKLDLFKRVLPALDYHDLSFYNKLSAEEKKQYSPYVILRYMSSNGNGKTHERALLDTNDWVNKHFWKFSSNDTDGHDHKELLHLLLCLCGQQRKSFHKWIKANNKRSNKLFQLLKQRYLYLNQQEYKILLATMTEDDIKVFCQDYAMNDDDIANYIKEFNNAKMQIL